MRRGQRVLSSLAGWGYHNGAAPRGKATLAKLVWQSSGPSFIVPTPRVARGAHEPPPAACPGQTPPTPTQLRSRRCRATLWMTTRMPQASQLVTMADWSRSVAARSPSRQPELPWRSGAGGPGPWRAREGAVRGCCRGRGAWRRAGSARRHLRRQRGQSGRVPGREPRSGQLRDHRRLVGLPGGHEGPLHAQGHLCHLLGHAGPRCVARSAPGLLPGETLGDGHQAGLGQPRARTGVLRRVGVPVQPATLPQPRPAVPHATAPGRRRRTRDLQVPAQDRADPASAATCARSTAIPAQFGREAAPAALARAESDFLSSRHLNGNPICRDITEQMCGTSVRVATEQDWPRIFPLYEAIVADGRTYALPQGQTLDEARPWWMEKAPGQTVVAYEDDLIFAEPRMRSSS